MDIEITGSLLIEAIDAALEKKKGVVIDSFDKQSLYTAKREIDDAIILSDLRGEIVSNYDYLIDMETLEYSKKSQSEYD
ncbi:hypothetical protein BIY29_08360 [Brenneria alni]|uniref:Uncharacterized protein n=1 Tax=Brenneria alni TaxID=71656 RepID=A0A421DPI5_9GAMM|nr:hypothetical protein [Brenneria alni]RLM24723.1 hypothetical protein BIY29_08360 [Brenneria alni]